MAVRGYALSADWSRGGHYTGALEDVSSYVVKGENVVASWGRTEPFTASEAAASKLNFTLNNHGRQFSPENAASPIAGMQRTGTPVRWTRDGVGLFTGPIDLLTVEPTRGSSTADIECLDAWSRLGDTELSTAVHQGKRTGDLITVILDAIGWPAAARSIDAGVTLVPYWWAEGTTAKTAVDELVASEGSPAIAYVRNGVFTFRDRHHRITRAASLTSQGTHTHIVPSGPIGTDHKIVRDTFTYAHGLDRIVNSATIEVTPRVPQNQEQVWGTTDPLALSPGEVVTLIIRTDNPCLDMQLPSATFPLRAGTDYTYDYQITSGSISFSLSRTSGQSALLTLTAGGSGAFLPIGVRVRGTPLTEGAARKFTASDPASQATYGLNEWPGTAPWAHYYDAQAIVDQVISNYAQPRPSVTFSIEARLSSTTLARILAAEIGDRIVVRNDEIGLNAEFAIEQLTHVSQQLGVKHTLTIGAQVVEQVQAANPFTFDAAGKGFNDGQFTAYAGNNPATMFRFDTAGVGFNQGVFGL